ncbi:ArdC family protein [Leptospira meyeri]|uniref:ArdC family protein n=1 Tax=Leptospira meyeri TaxID=29508 RepID=UPI000C2B291F|nr:zincin-like metallopeptidase domain-containing protein [Leptospira meyeri]PJZ79248.1 hypothetical protein CH359_18930 [Leptospira meyeri]PJZ95082.1 hypothetical protein CH358_18890 [Leptospira meyeri]
MKDQDVYKIIKGITKDVMAAIQSGSLEEWVKPWRAFGFPRNVLTRKEYGLFNSFLLTESLVQHKFTYATWGTVKQWNSLNYQIREGERSKTVVIFPVTIQVPVQSKNKRKQGEPEDEAAKYRSILIFKAHPVFNIMQTNAEESNYQLLVKAVHSKGLDRIDAFVNAIEHKVGDAWLNQAVYMYESDAIILPPKEHFLKEDDYWATYLHELGHWTGAKHRLNRNIKGNQSDYAFEELVAELCSAILAGEFGLSGNLQHKEYILSWIELLEKKPRTIFKASRLAMEAVEYLRDLANRGNFS